jgi:ERCC4-related helicase
LARTIWHHGKEIKSNIKKLEEIALQPKLWTDEDFYRQMIKQEEDQKQEGWTERVLYLEETLKRMKTCKKLLETATIEDFFPELRSMKKDMES